MARFPTREAEIRILAQNIINGLGGESEFSDPPIEASDLQDLLNIYIARVEEQLNAQATAQLATEVKNEALEELVDAMKAVLHYAEDAVGGNDAKLATLGWGGRAEPVALQPPGQPRNLEAPRQGAGWLTLDWKPPVDGGAPAFYKIERRQLPQGAWSLAGIAVDHEVTLTDQRRGTEWEYRVIAGNRAGASEPSNTAMAML